MKLHVPCVWWHEWLSVLWAHSSPSFTQNWSCLSDSMAKDVEWSRQQAHLIEHPTHMPQKLTAEIINAAIEGFESQKRRIDSQIAELRQLLTGGRPESAAASGAPVRRRKMSAAGRRRIAAAQKARWAKIRGEAEPASSPAPARQRRKLSAAGRKAISEATKRRWALKRAEAQKSESTVARKTAPKKTTGRKPRKKAQRAPEAAATAAA
jgi:hypothetical protein